MWVKMAPGYQPTKSVKAVEVMFIGINSTFTV